MAVFDTLFEVYDRTPPNKRLLHYYEELHLFAALLAEDLKKYYQEYEQIVRRSIAQHWKGEATGGLAAQKTRFIPEEFIDRLKRLSERSQQRLEEVNERLHESGPATPVERLTLVRTKRLLRKVDDFLSRLKSFEEKALSGRITEKERYELYTEIMREITNACRDLHELEEEERTIKQQVERSHLSELLKKIYEHPEIRRDDRGKDVLLFPVLQHELEMLYDESLRINHYGDSNYRIKWHPWWRRPRFETDVASSVKEPHVNVDIKLFGGKKKAIHLLKAA